MTIRGMLIGTVAGLLVGGATLSGAQAEPVPALQCTTVPDCQVALSRLYDDASKLGAEVNDLRRIRLQLERTAERRRERIERQADLIAELRSR